MDRSGRIPQNRAVAGLLIINADDLGHDARATDVILACFVQGSLTSATAMVHMRDSARAASEAREAGLPVGLHLNLTEPFDGPDTPRPVSDRQASLVRYFRRARWAHWVYNAREQRRIDDAISDQIEEFHALFGTPPAHVDGHEHVQECPNVVLARTLSPGTRLRRSYTFERGEKGIANRVVRAGLNRAITGRFRSTRWFFDIRHLHPDLGGSRLTERLALAEHDAVEVMTHPFRPDEHRVLTTPRWNEVLSGRPLGSWSDL